MGLHGEPIAAMRRRLETPFVNVKLIGGVFDATQKRSGDWGIGGNPLTTADVKNLAAGQPVA